MDAPDTPRPIRFYFDFASPYGYFAAREIDRLAAEFGREVEWRPILMWAVLKAHGIAAPLDAPARRAYLLNDMKRSAAFFGAPYAEPAKLPVSTHLAARLYHAVAAQDAQKARTLAHRLLSAYCAERRDIADEATLASLAAEVGIDAATTAEGVKGPRGRALLEEAVAEAVAAGVIGSPYFVLDGEGLFGADRLPQLRWLLSGGKA